ncbi:MAG: hypothetical protein ACTSYA_11530 [Candidatus Kariarchaeaceae archaeon]
MINTKSLKVIICLSLILFVIPSFSPVEADEEIESYIILFDEAHFSNYNHTLMIDALSSLNDSELGIEILFKIIRDPFNSTNLQGGDLVIIPNPGLDDGDNDVFDASEAMALYFFEQNGGSILAMSDPLSHNENLTGNSGALNSLLRDTDFEVSDNSFSYDAGTQEAYLIVNDIINDGSSEFLVLSPKHINEEYTVRNEPYNINQSIYTSTTQVMTPFDESRHAGNVSFYSYRVDSNLIPTNIQFNMAWFAVEQRDAARLALFGSTVMFSSTYYQNDSTKGLWIDQGDNMKLWKNTVYWLLGITPMGETNKPLTDNFMPYILAIAGIIVVIVVVGFLYSYSTTKTDEVTVHKNIAKQRDKKKKKETKKQSRKDRKAKNT